MEPEQDTREADMQVQELLDRELADIDAGEAARRFEAAVGQKVRQLRIERGWSQATVADRMKSCGFDLHQTAIAKLEAGKRAVRVDEVYALALVFGIPPQSFWYLPVSGEPQAMSQMRAKLEDIDKAIDAVYKSIQSHMSIYADMHAERIAVAQAINESSIKFQNLKREEGDV